MGAMQPDSSGCAVCKCNHLRQVAEHVDFSLLKCAVASSTPELVISLPCAAELVIRCISGFSVYKQHGYAKSLICKYFWDSNFSSGSIFRCNLLC